MNSGKCGCRSKLCPFSFGLALGLACGLCILLGSLWAMQYGLTPTMVQYNMPVPTLNEAVIHSLWALLKGFVFGFFVALFYDFFACCMRKCRKSDEACCGCSVPEKDKIERH